MTAPTGPDVTTIVAVVLMLLIVAWLAWATFRHPGDCDAPRSPGWHHRNGRIK